MSATMPPAAVSRSHRILATLSAIFAALAANCTKDPSADGVGGGAAQDASVDNGARGGSAGAGTSATGGTGGSGTGASGGIGGSGTGGTGGTAGAGDGGSGAGGSSPPPADGSTSDSDCNPSCFQVGGQYCGCIGSACAPGYLDCPPCAEDGFTCGGSGVRGLCGAARDSGACTPVECNQPFGQFCDVIGGGCGDTLDCGGCRPPFTCGGSGFPNVCGIKNNGDCRPLVCNPPGGNYCGAVGDGCGGALDCGACPGTKVCGERTPHVCDPPCPLCHQVPQCGDAGTTTTTVSGMAVTAAPNSPHPLYGALVYVPNIAPGAKLPPLADGPICNACPILTRDTAVASASTGPDGRFTLYGVPAGTGIPLVVQLGSWRMQTTIDVLPCVDNALPAGTVRLPRNQREGDIPLTAIATGNHDSIECLLRKMGIDDAEFTNPTGSGRIHVYRANGATIDANTPDETALKGTTAGGGSFARYSQVLLPCEGAEMLETSEALGNFINYVNGGGRVLTTHFGYVWLFHNGTLGDVGTWTTGSASPTAPLATDVARSSPRREDFATWLGLVGALSNATPPQIQITAPHADLGALTAGKGAEIWLSSSTPATSQALSIVTPVLSTPDRSCGRINFSDFHASGASSQGSTFPSECAADSSLSAEEKALEFLLLDTVSCASGVPPTFPPPPPPPPPAPTSPHPPPPPPPRLPPNGCP